MAGADAIAVDALARRVAGLRWAVDELQTALAAVDRAEMTEGLADNRWVGRALAAEQPMVVPQALAELWGAADGLEPGRVPLLAPSNPPPAAAIIDMLGHALVKHTTLLAMACRGPLPDISVQAPSGIEGAAVESTTAASSVSFRAFIGSWMAASPTGSYDRASNEHRDASSAAASQFDDVISVPVVPLMEAEDEDETAAYSDVEEEADEGASTGSDETFSALRLARSHEEIAEQETRDCKAELWVERSRLRDLAEQVATLEAQMRDLEGAHSSDAAILLQQRKRIAELTVTRDRCQLDAADRRRLKMLDEKLARAQTRCAEMTAARTQSEGSVKLLRKEAARIKRELQHSLRAGVQAIALGNGALNRERRLLQQNNALKLRNIEATRAISGLAKAAVARRAQGTAGRRVSEAVAYPAAQTPQISAQCRGTTAWSTTPAALLVTGRGGGMQMSLQQLVDSRIATKLRAAELRARLEEVTAESKLQLQGSATSVAVGAVSALLRVAESQMVPPLGEHVIASGSAEATQVIEYLIGRLSEYHYADERADSTHGEGVSGSASAVSASNKASQKASQCDDCALTIRAITSLRSFCEDMRVAPPEATLHSFVEPSGAPTPAVAVALSTPQDGPPENLFAGLLKSHQEQVAVGALEASRVECTGTPYAPSRSGLRVASDLRHTASHARGAAVAGVVLWGSTPHRQGVVPRQFGTATQQLKENGAVHGQRF